MLRTSTKRDYQRRWITNRKDRSDTECTMYVRGVMYHQHLCYLITNIVWFCVESRQFTARFAYGSLWIHSLPFHYRLTATLRWRVWLPFQQLACGRELCKLCNIMDYAICKEAIIEYEIIISKYSLVVTTLVNSHCHLSII